MIDIQKPTGHAVKGSTIFLSFMALVLAMTIIPSCHEPNSESKSSVMETDLSLNGPINKFSYLKMVDTFFLAKCNVKDFKKLVFQVGYNPADSVSNGMGLYCLVVAKDSPAYPAPVRIVDSFWVPTMDTPTVKIKGAKVLPNLEFHGDDFYKDSVLLRKTPGSYLLFSPEMSTSHYHIRYSISFVSPGLKSTQGSQAGTLNPSPPAQPGKTQLK